MKALRTDCVRRSCCCCLREKITNHDSVSFNRKQRDSPDRETNPHGVACVCDKRDEEAEDHVDEEQDEGVEVESAEEPHQVARSPYVLEGVEDISTDDGEQALGHGVQSLELWTQKEKTKQTNIIC